ncbi:hypothetical protein GAYE_SCF06G2695 [Galdieria yellowstonensis]|uniref:Methyltransferase FkbM domain-containing protein n=1 Tax=Galdieria yellowstonensis TaxID=3028027 RepID=A0AAV9IBU7_9RHOD|nr:hypothetical protein GAYE_SCF06G2695 [Galdieria yellowstonensis]
MGNIEFFDKKPYVQKQAIPAYSFRSLLSPEFDKVDNFKLQSYVLSTSKSVPPYYFVAYEPYMDSFVSSSMLETGVSLIKQYVNDTTVDCLVLDVGMNFGSFPLYAACKNCEVYGFEVQSSVIFAKGSLERQWCFRETWLSFPENNLGGTPVVYDNTSAGDESVLAVRIDEVIQYPCHITFAKLDIEGSEHRALHGMKVFLQNHLVDGSVIEIQDDDQSKQWISDIYDWGYVCLKVTECQYPLNYSAALQTFPFMTTKKKALEKSHENDQNYWCVPDFRNKKVVLD